MTDEAKREPLYQVWAIEKKTGNLVPMPHFPRIAKEQAEEWVHLVRTHIANGNVKDWSEPQALLHLG